MAIYLPHTCNVLREVESLTSVLTPRQIARWQRDTALWRDTGAVGIPLPRPLGRILRVALGRVKGSLARHHAPEATGANLVTWSSYVQNTIAPVGWWSMRATSGTNEPNRGSGGSALDMTITSATLGQTGKLGANEAALMDGANSRYQTANNAALTNLTTWEWVFLVNPSSAGEVAAGTFISWGNGPTTNEPVVRFSGTSLLCNLSNTVPTAFQATTTTALSMSAWSLLFVAYNDAGDRKSHLYKGVSQTVSEFAYSGQQAMTGTYRAPTNPLNLWNLTNQSQTFAGLGDEAIAVNGNLATATTRTQLTILAGA